MKKCILIRNPNSGKEIKNDIILKAMDIIREYDYEPELIISKSKGDITRIVTNIKKADLVISIGGDGTFNEAMSGNFKRKEPLLLAHIPLGTTNDIGSMFGYGKDFISNVRELLDGEIKDMDICCINGKPFIYVAGFGKFMNVPYETSHNLKKRLGYIAYLIEGIKEFMNTTKLHELSYEINGEKYHGLYSFMVISNANRLAGINNIYDDIKLDDGKFEVLFCNLTKKKDVLKTLYYLRMSDVKKVPGFYFHRTDNIKITFSKETLPWCIDGEHLEDERREYIINIPKKVSILMPSKNVKKLFEK